MVCKQLLLSLLQHSAQVLLLFSLSVTELISVWYHHCCCKIKNKNWNNLVKISKTLQHKVFFMVCFRILSEVCQSLTLYFCRADCWNSLKTTGWVEVFYDFIKRKYKSQGWQLEPSVKRGSERDVNFGRKPCECKSLKIYSKCTI